MKKTLTSLAGILVLNVYAQTWTPLSVGSAAEVYAISFPSEDSGYAYLSNNTLRKTNDAAVNWSTCSLPPNNLGEMDFVTSQRGFMVVSNGISMTTDGGQTWNTVLSNSSLDFFDVCFPGAGTGYATAVNANIDTAFVFKTTDGGANWNLVSTISGLFTPIEPRIYFYNLNTGFICIDYYIFKTADGGVTWNSVYLDPNMDLWISMHSPDGQNYFEGGYLTTLHSSTDGGDNWSQTTTMSYPVWGLYFTSATHGFFCGGNGLGSGAIEETNNAGLTWTPVYIGNSLWCMDFPSPGRGYAAGTSGVIVRYDDGPQNVWESNSSLITVYPNPASDFMQIENVSPGDNIVLMNSLGQVVKTEKAIDSRMQINISDLAEGVYHCEISSEGTRSIRKIVISRN